MASLLTIRSLQLRLFKLAGLATHSPAMITTPTFANSRYSTRTSSAALVKLSEGRLPIRVWARWAAGSIAPEGQQGG